jgi:hypothetical protein
MARRPQRALLISEPAPLDLSRPEPGTTPAIPSGEASASLPPIAVPCHDLQEHSTWISHLCKYVTAPIIALSRADWPARRKAFTCFP